MTTRPRHSFIGALALAPLVLAGCSSSTGGDVDTAGTAAPDGDAPHFIYITNDPIGVNEFLALGQVGVEAAAEEYGGTAETYESSDLQGMRNNLDAAVAEAPDAIVLITFDFDDLAVEYAQANPDQPFVLIDSCPAEVPENLRCGVFREHEAAYLAGVEAGLSTESGVVGAIGAVDIPFMHRYTDAFQEGAEAANPDVEVRQLFVGGENPFADPARAKEQALSLADAGADQVFAATAGGNGGIFEAAEEQDFMAYGVDVNQCPDAPGHVMDNVVKAVDVVVVDEIGAILDGEPGGGATSYGLSEGGMSLTGLTEDAADSGCVVVDRPEVLEQVRTAMQGIIDGEITVTDPTAA